MAAMDKKSDESTQALVETLKELFSRLPSTSATPLAFHFSQEVGGVPAEDIILPSGPVGALQETIVDIWDIAFSLTSDPAMIEYKAKETALKVKNNEVNAARAANTEAANAFKAVRTVANRDASLAASDTLARITREWETLSAEYTQAKLMSGETPLTAPMRALIMLLRGLEVRAFAFPSSRAHTEA